MPSATLQHILDLIDKLPEHDRLALEKRLSQRLDHDWQQAVQENRQLAAERGIDDAAIQRAIHRRRYGT